MSRNTVKKYLNSITILLLPILISLVVLIWIRKPGINFINDPKFSVDQFSDIEDGGNSVSYLDIKNKVIKLTYQLNNGYKYPYAGLIILTKNETYFDIDNYNFCLTVVADQDFRISIRMNQYLENYSDTSNPMSFLFMIKTIGLKKGYNEFVINTKDINEIPEWWFKLNQKKLNEIHSVSLVNTRSIWLFSDSSIPIGKPISCQVIEMKLVYNYYPWLFWTSILSLIYYITFFLIWKFKKEKNRYIFLPIETIKVNEKNSRSNEDILTYISANYYNSDFKIIDIVKHVGVSQDVITEFLRKHCNKSFRQYLNQIRMEEAKRLLKESSLQIIEIANKVGYNNVQHFNRVFKEYTNNSPKNYRDQQH